MERILNIVTRLLFKAIDFCHNGPPITMKTASILAAAFALSLGMATAADTAPAPAATGESAPAGGVTTETADGEEVVPESIPIPTEGAEFSPGAVDEPLPLIPEFSGNRGGFGPAPGVELRPERAPQLRQAIRIRELRTLVLQDPAVAQQWTLAGNAKTYEGRRVAMRNYYTLIAQKIIARDASLKEAVNERLRSQLRSLEQRHVRPSILVEPINPVPGSTQRTEARG